MLPDGRCVVLSSDSHDGYWKEQMHRRINITKRVCSRSTASIIMGDGCSWSCRATESDGTREVVGRRRARFPA
jgi:hypothetical protein